MSQTLISTNLGGAFAKEQSCFFLVGFEGSLALLELLHIFQATEKANWKTGSGLRREVQRARQRPPAFRG